MFIIYVFFLKATVIGEWSETHGWRTSYDPSTFLIFSWSSTSWCTPPNFKLNSFEGNFLMYCTVQYFSRLFCHWMLLDFSFFFPFSSLFKLFSLEVFLHFKLKPKIVLFTAVWCCLSHQYGSEQGLASGPGTYASMPVFLENSVHQSDSESDEDYVPLQDDQGIWNFVHALDALIDILQTLILSIRTMKMQL